MFRVCLCHGVHVLVVWVRTAGWRREERREELGDSHWPRVPPPRGEEELGAERWDSHWPLAASRCGSACYLPLRFCSTPYTSSSLLSPSKTGSRSRSSVSFMSSNHDCTGTFTRHTHTQSYYLTLSNIITFML